MAFNTELAVSILEHRDRDRARFFAGREFELNNIARAVDEARKDGGEGQAVFRIFQGAPGCGKTSLMEHFREAHLDDSLFVKMETEDLSDAKNVMDHIRRAARMEASRAKRAVAWAVETTGAFFSVEEAGRQAGDFVAGGIARQRAVVLHIDEAQTFTEAQAPVLKKFHTAGIGVPCVCVMTGLSHTASNVMAHDGLSRLANNAVHNMRAMSDSECEESTRRMLDELRADGTESEKKGAAREVATMAYGWPQHLYCAQQELVRELIRTHGAMRDVDRRAMEDGTALARERYYRGRLSGTVMQNQKDTLTAVLKRALDNPPHDMREMVKLCRTELEARGLVDDPDIPVSPLDFGRAMIAKGVVEFDDRNVMRIPIMSMATWLEVPGMHEQQPDPP